MSTPSHSSLPQPARSAVTPEPTRWSLILAAAADDGEAAREALNALGGQFLEPLYAYVGRVTGNHQDTKDAVHAFWEAKFPGLLEQAASSKGSFRGLLRQAMDAFLKDQFRRETRQKRDRRREVSISGEEDLFYPELRSADLTPDEAYDQAWAQDLLSRALTNLEAAAVSDGEKMLFDSLTEEVGTAGIPSAQEIAEALGISAEAFYQRKSRLRRELQDEIRRLIKDYCADAQEHLAECQWFFRNLPSRSRRS